MPNPEAALHASHDPMLGTTRKTPHDHVPISEREAPLNDESVLITTEVSTVYAQAPEEVDQRPIESLRNKNDDGVAREVKSIAKELIAN